jgi:hypothetical protein
MPKGISGIASNSPLRVEPSPSQRLDGRLTALTTRGSLNSGFANGEIPDGYFYRRIPSRRICTVLIRSWPSLAASSSAT